MRSLSYKLVKKDRLSTMEERVKMLQRQIGEAKSFIKEIENGNLTIDLDTQGDEDSLASSLLNMRDQMKKIADEEKQRNWATEGLARFVDILRSKNDNLKELGDVIISSVVKYMEANQGSLYVLNEDAGETHLELIASYAYNRKKHRTHAIGLGEGLAGQAVLEKSTLYMTNLPPDYLKISSGLGEALPKNLLIVPLMLNESVYGVIEMASFKLIPDYQREFLERLAESIASTLSAVRSNQHTRKLLTDTQMQAEQMRAQEEEMRQNMEELSATQEGMQRILKEVEGKEAYVNQLLNVSSDSIFTIDKDYKLVTWNKEFARSLEKFGMKLEKGSSTLDWYAVEERDKQVDTYNRALYGETFSFTAISEINGSKYYFLSTYAPVRNDKGEVIEAAIFSKDVTEMTQAQKKAEALRNEAQHQTEELKAQEEELRQNMEELSATQDEMMRILKEAERKEAYTRELLDVSKDMIFTVDAEYKLISWNRSFEASLEQFGIKMAKGQNTLEWYASEAERNDQIQLYKRIFNGETFDVTSKSDINGVSYYFQNSYTPLKDEGGNVIEAVIYARDVTASQTELDKLRKQEDSRKTG